MLRKWYYLVRKELIILILDNDLEVDLVVEEEATINSIIIGNVSVKNNSSLQLYGTVTKNLDIESGSKAFVFGCVNGNITNNGELEIYGEVVGALIDHTGNAFISRKAVVGTNKE